MDYFIREASNSDNFNVLHNLNEFCRRYVVKYGDFVLTAYVDCPQSLKDGQIRVSLNAGLKLDDFLREYDNLNDTQRRMLQYNMPEFTGWLINTKYEKDVNYVHYCRTNSNGGFVWLICNIIELESEKSIVEGIINLSYMAALTISEIHKSNIPFAGSQSLLESGMRNRMNVIEHFINYSQR